MYRNAYAISTKKLMALALVLVFLLSAFSFMRISLAVPIVAQVATSTYWNVLASNSSLATDGKITIDPALGSPLQFGLQFAGSSGGTFNVTAGGTTLSPITPATPTTPTTFFYEYLVPATATSCDVNVTATGRVTLPADKTGFYTVSPTNFIDVPLGSALTFSVAVNSAYTHIRPIINIGTAIDVTPTSVSSYVYTYTTPAIEDDITVTINDTDFVSSTSHTVTITASSKYSASPSNAISVTDGTSCTFEIIPSPVYQGNGAPIVTASGTTIPGTATADGWKYTINNVQQDYTIAVDTDAWGIRPGATTHTVTISQGTGYSVSQVLGSIYNSGVIYYVMDGNSLSFIVTPHVGFSKDSLAVIAGGTKINPTNNNLYTISNIQNDVIVNITITQENGYTNLTPLSLTDSAGRVTVTGMFTGSPVLSVSDIISGTSNYNTLYASAGKGIVLGAYDISLSSATVYGSLKLKFIVGTFYNGSTLWVLHYINGAIERHVVTVINGIAEITVSSLSPFMVVDPNGTIVTTTTTTTSIGPPRTGDVISMVGIAVVLISAAVFFGVRAYRKKQTKA